MAPIFSAILPPYSLIVLLHNDSGFSCVTCFGQWDSSKVDSRKPIKAFFLSLGTLSPATVAAQTNLEGMKDHMEQS